MKCEKIKIDKKIFDDIISELNMLKLSTNDSNSRKITDKVLDILKSCEEEDMKISLQKRIQEKMIEVKHKNSELNTSLYMLLREFENGKISKEETKDIFERLVACSEFDKKIY
ncbi:hypothetical protein [Clostridium uliginosum]|uniref:Uncharacterized protein n=1 Tax=Clostridium uliginosum TaxID=119641 RepID=A0A1I1MM48_9CLOT|nr:hypothetical protein [Clostridium uliginosum]SFC86461.1 hypothetical protein SAMN05421842_11169 [Clostridium uliginosum]